MSHVHVVWLAHSRVCCAIYLDTYMLRKSLAISRGRENAQLIPKQPSPCNHSQYPLPPALTSCNSCITTQKALPVVAVLFFIGVLASDVYYHFSVDRAHSVRSRSDLSWSPVSSSETLEKVDILAPSATVTPAGLEFGRAAPDLLRSITSCFK